MEAAFPPAAQRDAVAPDAALTPRITVGIAALFKPCAVPDGWPGVFDRTEFLGRRDEVVLRLLLDTGRPGRRSMPARDCGRSRSLQRAGGGVAVPGGER
jgi:hypothetical protein